MSDTDWPAPGHGRVDPARRPLRPAVDRRVRTDLHARRSADGSPRATVHDYGMPVRMIDVEDRARLSVLARRCRSRARIYARVHPPPLLWLLARVVPAMRRCERNAAHTLRANGRGAPARSSGGPRIGRARSPRTARSPRIDPDALDDARARAAPRGSASALAIDGYRLHFELHGTDMFPIGLLLDACREWGIDVPTVRSTSSSTASPTCVGARLDPTISAQCIVGGYDIDRPRLCETAARALPSGARRRSRAIARCPARSCRRHRAARAPRGVRHPLRATRARCSRCATTTGWCVGAWRMGLAAARVPRGGRAPRRDRHDRTRGPRARGDGARARRRWCDGARDARSRRALAARAAERARWARVRSRRCASGRAADTRRSTRCHRRCARSPERNSCCAT